MLAFCDLDLPVILDLDLDLLKSKLVRLPHMT